MLFLSKKRNYTHNTVGVLTMKKIFTVFNDWFFESWIWGIVAIIIVLIKPSIMIE